MIEVISIASNFLSAFILMTYLVGTTLRRTEMKHFLYLEILNLSRQLTLKVENIALMFLNSSISA